MVHKLQSECFRIGLSFNFADRSSNETQNIPPWKRPRASLVEFKGELAEKEALVLHSELISLDAPRSVPVMQQQTQPFFV